MIYLSHLQLEKVTAERFNSAEPYPWAVIEQSLLPAAFKLLLDSFPDLEQFEKHIDIPRVHGQRPHNRYYLAYEKSRYQTKTDLGTAGHDRLEQHWQEFIGELHGDVYREFIKRVFGVDDFVMRFAWHVGVAGSEVSPHVDAAEKIGTHIFYFNTSTDWLESWGGQTLVLGEKMTQAGNPDFSDFKQQIASPLTDNRSFIFKNTAVAWHGVKSLTCPPAKYRRLFNVVVERHRRRGFVRVLSNLLSGRATECEA